jgi:hypothetical protein
MYAAVATIELAPEDLEPVAPETTLELSPEDLIPCREPESGTTLELSGEDLLPITIRPSARSRRGVTLTLRSKEPQRIEESGSAAETRAAAETRLIRAEALESLRARSSSPQRARAMRGRRNRRRHAFFANVRALPLDGRDPTCHGVTADISKDGVFIHAATLPPLDSFVVLKIYAPRGTYSGLGRVVHRLDGIGFGCRFVDVDLDQRQTLDTLIE